MTKPKVILRKCPERDPDRIRAIVRESCQELGIKPWGKVLIKPNVVTANKRYIHNSYTDPMVTGCAIDALKEFPDVKSITIGESSGFGIPPGLFLSEAGYFRLAREKKVRIVDFNEEPCVPVPLRRGVHHKTMLAAQSLAQADFKLWIPKLKFHICCQITNALKLNVGILTHKERMFVHDDRLDEKIVDLLEAGYPDLVISDAIDITHGFESAPYPFRLGVIIISRDPVATDAVAAHVMGYEPNEVAHLKQAADRGWGTIDLNEIEIAGDCDTGELREKTSGIISEFQDIHKVDTPIKFYCGDAPDRNRFCHGGCLAAVKGCLGTSEKRRPGSLVKARRGAIVTGIFHGDVIHPGEPVLLVGTCTRIEGKTQARKVRRIRGCPTGAKQLMLAIPFTFGIPSPMFDPRDAALFIYFTLRHTLSLLSLPVRSLLFRRKIGKNPGSAKGIHPSGLHL